MKSRSFAEMDPETIVVIIWGLVKRGRWLEAKRVAGVLNLIKMKTKLGQMEVSLKSIYFK